MKDSKKKQSSKQKAKITTTRLVCLILAGLMVLGSITLLITFLIQNWAQ